MRERANGLYGPGAYLVANTLTSIPFLFLCTLVYTLIMYVAALLVPRRAATSTSVPDSLYPRRYWVIGLHPGASHFFKVCSLSLATVWGSTLTLLSSFYRQFLIYLFLGVFAAESQSLLLAALVPVFVAALALASFANGLWMVRAPLSSSSSSTSRADTSSCHSRSCKATSSAQLPSLASGTIPSTGSTFKPTRLSSSSATTSRASSSSARPSRAFALAPWLARSSRRVKCARSLVKISLM